MSLDINTKKGQESLIHEREVQEIIKKKWKLGVLETPKLGISACDGFLIKKNEMVALFETKCRYDMTYEELLTRGSWLITEEKIKKCKTLSILLQIPFYGFLYLLPKSNPDEKILLCWKITNEKGKYLFDFEVRNEQTQRSINGGQADRYNAYLPIDKMNII